MMLLSTLVFCTFLGALPSEFYLDTQLPVDHQEAYVALEKLASGLVIPEQKIAFEDLPNEVKEVVYLDSDESYLDATFVLWVTLGPDPAAQGRSVKVYTYTPLEYNEALEGDVLVDRSWCFSRQDGRLKLRWPEPRGLLH